MQAFREGRGTCFNIPESMSIQKLPEFLFGDFNPLDRTIDHPTVIFVFEAAQFGHERYVAVTAEGMVIVPPFQYDDRATIPLFPQERKCSASR